VFAVDRRPLVFAADRRIGELVAFDGGPEIASETVAALCVTPVLFPWRALLAGATPFHCEKFTL
jgi:hypothetical protein